MTLGIIILLIVVVGFVSNWLNGRYLNFKITHYLYYIGAFVHETSHAIMCKLTGAKIQEYSVFSEQPHVTHTRSRLPIVGGILISSAPIFGGILFLFLINYFLPSINISIIHSVSDWKEILLLPIELIKSVNIFSWHGLVLLLLLINSGAMIGPSLQDMKNIWVVFIPFLFFSIPYVNDLCFTAFIIILANIYIQIVIILLIKCLNIFKK